jgi:hypothetical protein
MQYTPNSSLLNSPVDVLDSVCVMDVINSCRSHQILRSVFVMERRQLVRNSEGFTGGRRRNCDSISRARLIPSSKRPDGCGAQKFSYSTTAGGPLPELKRSDHEANHSSPLIADVLKNMYVRFSMCLHGVKRDDLTVIIIALF